MLGGNKGLCALYDNPDRNLHLLAKVTTNNILKNLRNTNTAKLLQRGGKLA